MGDYRVEIRSVEGEPAGDPDRFVLTHHRSETAEFRVGTLTGGALLHLAVAGCVFNSVFRLAEERGIALRDCRVRVEGEFDEFSPRSTGIEYEIELSGAAPAPELEAIARAADAESTIPNLLRMSGPVSLRAVTPLTTTP